MGNKESKISNNIQKKILKDNSKCASKLCKKYIEINDKNIDELLNERDFSAYRRARLLSWCIDANSDLNEQLRKIMEKYIDIPDSGKKVNFFELYHRDVIIYRNALAHVKNAPEKETSCFVVEIAGDIIVFNRELCDKLRKTLLSYEKILDEMFDYIERNY